MLYLLLTMTLLFAPTAAFSAVCDAGYYLSNSACTKCPITAYCPGDDGLYSCMDLYGGDYTITSALSSSSGGATSPDECTCYFNMLGDETSITQMWKGKCSVGPTEVHYIQPWWCHVGYYATDCDADNHCKRCAPCTNAPENSEYTSFGQQGANDCPWKCSTGYLVNSDATQCEPLCNTGITYLNTSTGVKVPLYANRRTNPSINIKINDNICYADLMSGRLNNAININYNSEIYHTVSAQFDATEQFCDAGYFLNPDNVCEACTSGHYCPGDNTRISCETIVPEQPGISPPTFEYRPTMSKPQDCYCLWPNLSDETKSNYRVLNECYLGMLNQNIYVRYDGCRTGHYAINPKTMTDYGDCVPCTNAPENAHYTSYSTPSVPQAVESNCPWECDDGYVQNGNECISI